MTTIIVYMLKQSWPSFIFICPLCHKPGLYSAKRTDGVCTDCANNGRTWPAEIKS